MKVIIVAIARLPGEANIYAAYTGSGGVLHS
jgi:hypothetical protein